jgi:hypothetical protein
VVQPWSKWIKKTGEFSEVFGGSIIRCIVIDAVEAGSDGEIGEIEGQSE